MRFAAFRAAAERAYGEIPERFKTGIEGLIVSRDVVPSPGLPDVYTLGECLTESWPSDWQGPDTTRSSVVLYWGSFESLSEHDPEFDWDDEIWETLTHELRHHLESLADEDRLEEVDYAMDQGFHRAEGLVFDPGTTRGVTPKGRAPTVWRSTYSWSSSGRTSTLRLWARSRSSGVAGIGS